MSDRLKDRNWSFTVQPSGHYSWDSIHAALAMDIRDELKRLNSLLHCQNTLDIPRVLKRIDRRLAKKIPLR